MTHIEQFIKDAIDGGWKDALLRTNPNAEIKYLIEDGYFTGKIEQILLDPLAWEACGKTRNWGETDLTEYGGGEEHKLMQYEMEASTFMSNIIKGKTIEESLALISK